MAFAAGRLTANKLVSLWGIDELRFIDTRPDSIVIGAGTTFSDLRANPIVASEFPLLDKAASWIGSIANQSRATLGGNLVNGSPAADSSPALLVYDAEIELISVRGKRRMPYREFHTGYKQNVMTADELLYAIHLPRRFAQHRQYLRKVGTRRAMAISKVALGATALIERWRRSTRFAWPPQASPPFLLGSIKTETRLAGKTLTQTYSKRARQAHCSPKRSQSTTFAPPREYRKAVWRPICSKNSCSALNREPMRR